jgi:hypothetical protein
MRDSASVEIWSDEGLDSFDGEVAVDGSAVSVSYDADGYQVVYKGKEVEQGHFQLWCHDPDIDGEATLHAFSGSRILEGFWRERKSGWGEGMWRVRLLALHTREPRKRGMANSPAPPGRGRVASVPGPVIDWNEVEPRRKRGRSHGLEFEHLQAGPVAFMSGYPLGTGAPKTIGVAILARPPRGLAKTIDWPTVVRETREAIALLFTPNDRGWRRPHHGQRVGNIRVVINE